MADAVLIVDDSLTVRMDLADAFQAAGLEGVPCASIAEARRIIGERQVGVIILDVVLPDGDGVEFLRELRASSAGSEMGVLMLSTEAEVADRIRGLSTGADEYVGKPYDTGYVISRARELMGARHGSEAASARSVLVVDDSVTYREQLREALEASGYVVLTAADGEEGLRTAADRRPNAIIVDGRMPGIDGATVVRRIRLDAALRGTPCLLLTAEANYDAEIQAYDAGADAFVRKDGDTDLVIARLAAVLRRASEAATDETASLAGPKRILAVDDSLTYLEELTEALRGDGYEVVSARSGEEALKLLSVQPVDCILLDLVMPGLGGQETCALIKAAPGLRDIPLILLTAVDDRAVMLEGLSAGADDYIQKSGEWQVLKARMRAQLRRKQFEDENRRIRDELQRTTLEIAEAKAARDLAETRATLIAELDQRVVERTAELASANAALQDEMAVRRRAEAKANAQAEQMTLLHQITRAISERQDLDSIFKVVVRSVETQLPADFAGLCLYDAVQGSLSVAAIGVGSRSLASRLAMPERTEIDIDNNGLSRCVAGELVHEPDTAAIDVPFSRRLARAGLGALVAAPLQIEGKAFGILIAARAPAQSFSSGDCEFLRQLGEHAALAAHQAQLHAALQDAYDDLRQSQQTVLQQERLRALGQMASGIAHDINNALSPVALYAESMLATEAGLSQGGRAQLEIVQRAVEDVTQTIARMREFYRLREPQLSLAPVRVNDLVQQVIDLTRARWNDMAMQRGVVIDVQTELAADLPAVLGVESEIREALINLVLNAVDAMPTGGTLLVRTRVAGDAPDTVDVAVEDDGIGMDEATRLRCLEPFFTTKGERGTGLGLAMVYGVAQRHGAELSVRSSPGAGTTVRLAFLAAKEGAAEPAGGDAPLAPAARLRLLIVDDDPVLLEALAAALQREGHAVTAAAGGQAGIDAFRAAQRQGELFSAVITDLGMPHVDGRKVAHELKALSPSTPILLLTGWGRGLLPESDLPPHVDEVLGKPPRIREIREALSRHCAGAALEEGLVGDGSRRTEAAPPHRR